MEPIDLELLKQMIEMNAITPDDFMKIFHHIISYLMNLQAPVHLNASKSWWKQFIEEFRRISSENISISVKLNQFVSMIPKYFTYCSQIIEEIHQDVSFYYDLFIINVCLYRCVNIMWRHCYRNWCLMAQLIYPGNYYRDC